MSYQTKHTPGPWKHRSYNDLLTASGSDGDWQFQTYTIQAPDNKIIGAAEYSTATAGWGWITNIEEAEANAHLIAAAPDLLSALMKAVESVNNNNVNRKYSDYVIPDWYFGSTGAIEKALNIKPFEK